MNLKGSSLRDGHGVLRRVCEDKDRSFSRFGEVGTESSSDSAIWRTNGSDKAEIGGRVKNPGLGFLEVKDGDGDGVVWKMVVKAETAAIVIEEQTPMLIMPPRFIFTVGGS